MLKTRLLSGTSLLIAGVLLLVINVLAMTLLPAARFDLTQSRLYTLSDGTKSILSKLDEPITLRFYFSEKALGSVPSIMTYGRRVRELLEEYASISNGKIKLIVADPVAFSDEEDQAVRYGLQGVPIDAGGSLAYFGLAGTNTVDGQEVVGFFQPEKEDALEYDLTKLVYKLTSPKAKVVGLLSTLPMDGGAPNPFAPQSGGREWMILSQLKQLFDVRNLGGDIDRVPDNVNVLMLVHPKGLSEKTQYAIDQFVLRGGRAMVFVDPYAEQDVPPSDPNNPMAAMGAPRSSNLEKLFDAWGVQLVPGRLALDVRTATRVTVRGNFGPQNVDYVAWLTLDPSRMNRSDFVTDELKKITIGSGGVLVKKGEGTTRFTPLLETSEEAMLGDVSRLQFGPDPVSLIRDYQRGGKKLALAARLSGKVKTAFPNGAPAGVDGANQIKESKEDVNILVIADTDLLADAFWVDVQDFFGNRVSVPRASNDAFVINAVDNLSGSNDLISLRSREKSARPFEKVQELKQETEQQFRERERQLQAHLQETERKISEMQRQKEGGNKLILSPEQRAAIEKFRAEQVQTRKDLRGVQHELTKNIESLGTTLKILNIGAIPVLVIVLAMLLALIRVRRMKRHSLA